MTTICRPIAQLAIFALLAAPAGAATVTFSQSVRDKTPAALGIPAGGVAPQGLKPYQADRAGMKARASAAFEKNPVAAQVRGGAAEESENEHAVKFKNGSVELEISKAAGAEILLDLARYTVGEAPKRAVDEKLLERDARQYIREQMPDVNPGEVGSATLKKIMDSVAKVSDDGTTSEVKSGVANYILIFKRRINKIPVVGPGEQIRVYLSSSGEVIGHSKIWRELDTTPRPARPVVPSDQAQKTLAQALARHPAPRVEVDFFEFGYLTEGRYTKQSELKPVYVVGYRGNPEEKRAIKLYDAYTGAEIAPPADPPGADKKDPQGADKK